MNEQLRVRFERDHRLYVDLVSALSAEQLGSRLGTLPSNTIGAQLWCVVGARESYARAARAGAWQGFSCGLAASDVERPEAVLDALTSAHGDVVALLSEAGALTGTAVDYLMDLLEHEAQHQGQLIRYLYGLGIARPRSWKERYALE